MGQSSESAFYKQNTDDSTRISLSDIKVDARDWTAFKELKELSVAAKEAILEDAIKYRIKELLYENPDLVSHYALQYDAPRA